MQWAFLAIIVAALLYLARFYPKIGFGILGALVLGAIIIVLTTSDSGFDYRSRLPVEKIIIENPLMTKAYGGSFRFNARLANSHTEMELREATISITLLDCKAENNCQVVGQQDERVNIRIPAGQARDISRTVNFSSAVPEENIQWEFTVTHTRS